MVQVLAFGKMSDDQVAAFIVKMQLGDISWTNVAKRLKIPKQTLSDVVNGKTRTLRKEEYRERLHKAARKGLSFPWSMEENGLRDTVRSDFENLVSCSDSDRLTLQAHIQAWHTEAKAFWIELALNRKADPVKRVFFGRLGAYVTLQLTSNHALRNALSEDFVKEIDRENRLTELGAVYRMVAHLLKEERAAHLFEGEFSEKKQCGARWLRFLTWNDYQGWLIAMTHTDSEESIEKRNNRMRRVVQRGFVDESNWAAEVTGKKDILPLKNPWTALVLGGFWDASVQQAKAIFEQYPEHLYKTCQGQGAIISDTDNWPGLAAIANNPLIPGLGIQRDWLANAEMRNQKRLSDAIQRMRPIIAQGGSHQDAMSVLRSEK